MTDSIPLVALPLKLFRAWLPPGFSAIQFWLAFSYLMQPIAAVFALRSSGETKLLPAIAVTLFSISMPTFIFRHPHVALSSHFVLLFALGSYFLTTRGRRSSHWLPPVMLPVSLLTHPYVAVMTFGDLGCGTGDSNLALGPTVAAGDRCGRFLNRYHFASSPLLRLHCDQSERRVRGGLDECALALLS